ncbi:MAG: ATP-binding cassette domain-containing protein [Endomicrobiales bacterium]|nr:ATP-binding cassette domain-containing protein [Endomicrobiales bacterium]
MLALKNRGILVHGAGYFLSSREYPSKNSGVYLFIGRSGAGKSSLIKILGREYALSDELVHIYEKSGRIFGASTPFWGELKKGCGKVYQGKIKNIFLLEHSKTNAIKSLRSNEAVKGILKNVLFFSKNNRNIEKLLNLSSNITKKLSIYGLGFRLDVKRKDLIGLISEKYEN